MIWQFASVTALLKNKAVFSLFNFWPETSSYTDSNSKNLLHSSELALQKRRLSSERTEGAFHMVRVPSLVPFVSKL